MLDYLGQKIRSDVMTYCFQFKTNEMEKAKEIHGSTTQGKDKWKWDYGVLWRVPDLDGRTICTLQYKESEKRPRFPDDPWEPDTFQTVKLKVGELHYILEDKSMWFEVKNIAHHNADDDKFELYIFDKQERKMCFYGYHKIGSKIGEGYSRWNQQSNVSIAWREVGCDVENQNFEFQYTEYKKRSQ